MGGVATVKKKIKRATDYLGSKRLQRTTDLQPATPTKKDNRPWEWNTPRRSGAPQPTTTVSSQPLHPTTTPTSQPLPALLSLLAATFSPRSKARHPAPSTDLSAPIESHAPPPSDAAPCSCENHGDDFSAIFEDTAPAPLDNEGTEDSELEDEEEPDVQDGVDGNYHAVSITVSIIRSLSDMRSLLYDARNSSPLDMPIWRAICWTSVKPLLRETNAQYVRAISQPSLSRAARSTTAMIARSPPTNALTAYTTPIASIHSTACVPGTQTISTGVQRLWATSATNFNSGMTAFVAQQRYQKGESSS